MSALLLVAHGSKVAASNDEVRRVADALRARASARFSLVECAFLELSPPDITQGLASCVAAGETDIVVLPYFLAAGRHVRDDIPRIVDEARAQHADVRITVAPYLGSYRQMTEVLLEIVS